MHVSNLENGDPAKAAAVRVGLFALTVFSFSLAVSAVPATSVAQTTAQTTEFLTRGGTTKIHSLPLGSGVFQIPEIDTRDTGGDVGFKGATAILGGASPFGATSSRRTNRPIPSKEVGRMSAAAMLAGASPALSLTLHEPVVESDTVVSSQANGFLGFNGLSHVDQRLANGGNQFSLEPPDQGLCVGRGFVVEAVNNAIRVFDTHGNALAGVEGLSSFFGLATEFNRTTGVVGPFLSDPKCYYDRQSGHWFVSELMQDTGTNTGATGRSFNMLAVSKTTDPTDAFEVFKYDVTDDGLHGTANHAGCPCFGDQPLLGADKYGIYQSTNEFGSGLNGAQVYAISKAKLIAAAISSTARLPVVVHIDASQQLVPFGGLSYSIQPATSPGGNEEERDPGVEFFLSALQFGNPGFEVYDNRIAVWALTNTRSLNNAHPVVNLSFNVLHSETYGQPDPANQMKGPIPLGKSVKNPEELINTNDDRMNQVVYAGGLLYGGVNSKLAVAGESQTGIAWFAVRPSFRGPNLTGQVVHQGYVAIRENNAYFPSLGINSEGNGVIAFSISGDTHFPSAAYVVIKEGHASPFVHIAGAGQDPDDGFTGYPAENGKTGNVGRWGDYSAAVADGNQVWFATEYIPNACSALTLPCRTLLANWGTFVAKIAP